MEREQRERDVQAARKRENDLELEAVLEDVGFGKRSEQARQAWAGLCAGIVKALILLRAGIVKAFILLRANLSTGMLLRGIVKALTLGLFIVGVAVVGGGVRKMALELSILVLAVVLLGVLIVVWGIGWGIQEWKRKRERKRDWRTSRPLPAPDIRLLQEYARTQGRDWRLSPPQRKSQPGVKETVRAVLDRGKETVRAVLDRDPEQFWFEIIQGMIAVVLVMGGLFVVWVIWMSWGGTGLTAVKNPPPHGDDLSLGFSQPGSKGRASGGSSNIGNVGKSRVPGGSSNTGNVSKPRTIPPSPKTAEARLRLESAERKLVQQGLAELNHEPGRADGKFGSKTRAALRRWQASRGYTVTGYLDRDQADELIVAGRNARPIPPSSSPSYPPGKYQLAKDAPLLKEPRDSATVITKLSSGTKVNITENRGDYLKVVSKSNKPPGWLHRDSVAPPDDQPDEAAVTPGKRFRDCPACPQMVAVPAGSYRMGSPSHEKGRDGNEGPQHSGTISRPFAVGVYEVTQGEFAQFVVASGYSAGNFCEAWEPRKRRGVRRRDRNWRRPGFIQTERDPIVCVNWEDAQTYVRWLSQQTGQNYRLLSEAEWEYVARAGTQTRYWWGNEIKESQANHDLNERKTVRVGSYQPNGFGLWDVHGNVREWVQDCWHDNYNGAPRNGGAWEGRNCGRRVLRGGSWLDTPETLRSANRDRLAAGDRSSSVGFRIARSLP